MSTIKKCFHSRFDNGLLFEVDYSQLEVIVLAHLSQDPVLMDDIRTGMDMHTHRAAQLFNIPKKDVTKEQRTITKVFSFQLQYGSGAKNMAETFGLEKSLAQRFIDQYYDRYKLVKAFQEHVMGIVENSRVPILANTPGGSQKYRGEYISETGRTYTFETYDPPSWKTTPQFSPTQMKNYPVQGTATGDIVPMMLGELHYEIRATETQENKHHQILLINTVHDSFILDVEGTRLATAYKIIDRVLKNTNAFYEQHFGVEFNLPLKFEVEAGKNWEEMVNVWDVVKKGLTS